MQNRKNKLEKLLMSYNTGSTIKTIDILKKLYQTKSQDQKGLFSVSLRDINDFDKLICLLSPDVCSLEGLRQPLRDLTREYNKEINPIRLFLNKTYPAISRVCFSTATDINYDACIVLNNEDVQIEVTEALETKDGQQIHSEDKHLKQYGWVAVGTPISDNKTKGKSKKSFQEQNEPNMICNNGLVEKCSLNIERVIQKKLNKNYLFLSTILIVHYSMGSFGGIDRKEYHEKIINDLKANQIVEKKFKSCFVINRALKTVSRLY